MASIPAQKTREVFPRGYNHLSLNTMVESAAVASPLTIRNTIVGLQSSTPDAFGFSETSNIDTSPQVPTNCVSSTCDVFHPCLSMLLSGSTEGTMGTPSRSESCANEPRTPSENTASYCQDRQVENTTPYLQRRGRFLVWPVSFGPELKANCIPSSQIA